MTCECSQSCLTLFNPMDCSLPGSSIHGILQARILEWVAISFSRISSWPRDWTWVLRIVGRRFTIWATREVPFSSSVMSNSSAWKVLITGDDQLFDCYMKFLMYSVKTTLKPSTENSKFIEWLFLTQIPSSERIKQDWKWSSSVVFHSLRPDGL